MNLIGLNNYYIFSFYALKSRSHWRWNWIRQEVVLDFGASVDGTLHAVIGTSCLYVTTSSLIFIDLMRLSQCVKKYSIPAARSPPVVIP